MTQPAHAAFTGNIPELYHQHLGPVLFEPYARDLAARLPSRRRLRVLELAAGTGIVSQRLLSALPDDGALTVTDLNEAMLAHARRTLPADERLSFRAADAQALPFEDGSFDAVVMQFGIMFVPDKAQVMREAKRVLTHGGALIYNAWDSFERNAYGRIANDVIRGVFPTDPPTFYQTPFGDHDPREHRTRTEAAGFRDVTVEGIAHVGESESAAHFATGLVRGNPVSIAISERGSITHAEVEARVEDALQRELGDKPTRTPMHAWVVTGTA